MKERRPWPGNEDSGRVASKLRSEGKGIEKLAGVETANWPARLRRWRLWPSGVCGCQWSEPGGLKFRFILYFGSTTLNESLSEGCIPFVRLRASRCDTG